MRNFSSFFRKIGVIFRTCADFSGHFSENMVNFQAILPKTPIFDFPEF